MTLVAVTGAAGTHGVTTLTAGLAQVWPGPVVLVECDPSGGDVGAWWDLPAFPALASAVAEGSTDVSIALAHAPTIGDSLRVLAAPVRTAEATVTVSAATQRVLPILAATSYIVGLVDVGQSGPGVAPALGQAALTVVVARQVPGSTRATAAILERSGDLLDDCAARSIRTVVALIGDDPYPPAEVARYLGVAVHSIADDPLGASVIAGRPATGRLASRSRLLQSVRPLAVALQDQLASMSAVAS